MDFFRVFLKSPINEKLTCYILNSQEAMSIEPDTNNYFINKSEELMVMEASEYYVTQIKKNKIEEQELLDAALELQKEALWNRCKLEDKLYLRKLFEDNFHVVQLWRPIIVPDYL